MPTPTKEQRAEAVCRCIERERAEFGDSASDTWELLTDHRRGAVYRTPSTTVTLEYVDHAPPELRGRVREELRVHFDYETADLALACQTATVYSMVLYAWADPDLIAETIANEIA